MIRDVGYDNDGVVSNSVEPVIRHANILLAGELFQKGKTPFAYTSSDIKCWDYLFKDILERTEDEILAKRANSLWFNAEVLGQAKPMPNSALAIRVLGLLRINQQIITSRKPLLRPSTMKWFSGNIPYFARNDRVIMKEAGDERGSGRFKLETLWDRGISFFVDDDPLVHDLMNTSAVPKIRHYMFTQPWNKDRRDLDSIRVHSWLQIMSLILFSKQS